MPTTWKVTLTPADGTREVRTVSQDEMIGMMSNLVYGIDIAAPAEAQNGTTDVTADPRELALV